MTTDQDFAWLIDHGAELVRDYEGKWIAVAGERIVGVGDSALAAAAEAREQAPGRPFILEHVLPVADIAHVRS